MLSCSAFPQKGKTLPNEYPDYVTKLSDGEALAPEL